MKILFVSSAKRFNSIDSLIYNQAISLSLKGVDISHFLIKTKGFFGYIKSIFSLCKTIREKKIEIVHAHYGLCGFVSILGSRRVPVIISFMGSDLHGGKIVDLRSLNNNIVNRLNALFSQLVCKQIIVKSDSLKKYLYPFPQKIVTIPNGVDINKFNEIDQSECKRTLELLTDHRYILFLGGLNDQNKNHSLFNSAIQLLNNHNLIALTPFPVDSEKIKLYINAADVLVSTSFKEGSPNVIKEAMACNCPIVSTDVGDVREVIDKIEGCYITSFDSADVAEKIRMALEFSGTKGRTNGRQRILELGLDSESVSKRIVEVYKKVLNG